LFQSPQHFSFCVVVLVFFVGALGVFWWCEWNDPPFFSSTFFFLERYCEFMVDGLVFFAFPLNPFPSPGVSIYPLGIRRCFLLLCFVWLYFFFFGLMYHQGAYYRVHTPPPHSRARAAVSLTIIMLFCLVAVSLIFSSSLSFLLLLNYFRLSVRNLVRMLTFS